MSMADTYAKVMGWDNSASNAAPAPNASSFTATAEAPDQTGGSRRQQSVDFWVGKGAPRHVAEGITDALDGESGLDPNAFNPAAGGQGAFGTGQWRGERQARLKRQPNYTDFGTQLGFAYGEVTGGDPIASAHWKEILAAPDRATAKRLWSRYFERPGQPVTQADNALISDDALRYGLKQPNAQTVYGNVYDLLALLPDPDEKTAGGRSKGNSLRQSVLERGEQIEVLPQIDVTVDKNGRARITDYDGLHRLKLLADMGVNAVPVVIAGVPQGTEIKSIEGMHGGVRPFDFAPVPASAVPPPPRSWWEKVGSGLGMGATDPVYGAAQIGARISQTPGAGIPEQPLAPLPPDRTSEVDTAVRQREADYQAQRQAEGDTGIDWGRLVGNAAVTAPLAAIPGVGAGGAAVNAAARAGAGVLGRLAAGVGAGAGTGAAVGAGEGAVRPVTEPGEFGSRKAGQIGEGALFGAAGGAVMGAGSAGVNVIRSVVSPTTVTQAVTRLFGKDAKRLTPELLADVRSNIQGKLNRIEGAHDVHIDDQLVRDLGTTQAKAVDLLGETEARPISDALERILGRARGDGIIPARSAATLWHRGSRLDNLTESRNPDIARLAQAAQNAVREALNRQLSPAEAAEYSLARGQWRDLKIVEKTLRPGETMLDPRRFVTQVGRRFPNQASQPGGPPMLQLGRAAGETFPAGGSGRGDLAGLLGSLLGHILMPGAGGIVSGHVGGRLTRDMLLGRLAEHRLATPNALQTLRMAFPPNPIGPTPPSNAMLLLNQIARGAPVAAAAPLSYEIAR